jgi:hypothetical protein
MTQKKRTDIFNLNGIADKANIKTNKKQKITTAFQGVAIYCTNPDIKEMIRVIETESKEQVKALKLLLTK